MRKINGKICRIYIRIGLMQICKVLWNKPKSMNYVLYVSTATMVMYISRDLELYLVL